MGMGSAMDLVAGVQQVVVTMDHMSKSGAQEYGSAGIMLEPDDVFGICSRPKRDAYHLPRNWNTPTPVIGNALNLLQYPVMRGNYQPGDLRPGVLSA